MSNSNLSEMHTAGFDRLDQSEGDRSPVLDAPCVKLIAHRVVSFLRVSLDSQYVVNLRNCQYSNKKLTNFGQMMLRMLDAL
jgi:hypothetical protein